MEAEQVSEILRSVGTLAVKPPAERGEGDRLIHEIVGALMADGEPASAALVLSAQIPLYDDCPFRKNAEAGGSVLMNAQRRYAVRDKADLICILFGKAAVE